MHTKISHYWRVLNLWLLQKTWWKSRIHYVTPTSFNRVQEYEPTQKGKLTSWRKFKFCSITRRSSHGLKRHCIAISTNEKPFRQVFIIRGGNSNALQRQFMSLWSSTVAFAWKWETLGKNFQNIQSNPQRNWCDWSCKFSKCLLGRLGSSGRFCSGRFFRVRYWHFRRI